GIIEAKWVARMAKDAIVFACANPIPEIWPWEAQEAGAKIVATGRGDFQNQVNNSLGFPGIFRGVLDVRARTITDEMAIAAARELARFAEEQGMSAEKILPRMDEWEVYPRLAVAVGKKAQQQGVARVSATDGELYDMAWKAISTARKATELLMEGGIIPAPPTEISLKI
ncbi:MAG TPA: malic enzyme-like NAD(P)-binding protein, partial [Vicinamibacteria bacterium]